jgi:hypothetical protein
LGASAPNPYERGGKVPKKTPSSYKYVGPEDLVLVEHEGTTYEFRRGAVVHLPSPSSDLDKSKDFERVED